MKTILATTYAVNPYKGSEDGMGWNYVLQIAKNNKVIAITRENNQNAIEKYMDEHPNVLYKNITFLYFDLPYWMRWWKKGGRGAMLYYWMWQKGVIGFVTKQNLTFDIAHNLNFHNDWTPSYLWKLGKPFVWGPVGHHPLIPAQYLSKYSIKHLLKDRFTWLVKNYFWKYSKSLRNTTKNADFVWCMNESVPERLHLKPSQYEIIPSVASQDFGYLPYEHSNKFTFISVGRLVPLKGFDLTLQAFAVFYHTLSEIEKANTELLIVGSGPEEKRLIKMAADLKISENVQFIIWMERAELMKIFKQAQVFLFPSHEGAGMVVPEALSFGLPVVCLDNCGPGSFITDRCGIKISEDSYVNTVDNLAQAIKNLYKDKTLYANMRHEARVQFEKVFHWDRRGEQLAKIYKSL
ncbi:MAG: glycosyltransferase [Saprospiraceae bacterium]